MHAEGSKAGSLTTRTAAESASSYALPPRALSSTRAIGAHSVEWFDFLLWQSLSHEQYIIDRVKAKTDLVALAHPATRDAYTPDDLQQLTGYDLIEVVNGPFAGEDVWDAG